MLNIIPTVGTLGVYKLAAPFDILMAPGELYECKSVRKISEIYANNEDPEVLIYKNYEIDEATFNVHKNIDIEIAYLRSEKGHWLYVPVSFIQSYPDPNGIIYRSVAVTVLLPAIPVEQNLTNVTETLSQLTSSMLGLPCTVKTVFTSRPIAVDKDRHEQLTLQRKALVAGNVNYHGMYVGMKTERDALALKVTQLEAYIKASL